MNKAYFIVGLCWLLFGLTAGWWIEIFTRHQDESLRLAQAIPVIRNEHFDAARNTLMISLFNPGTMSMEIDRTELTYQTDSNHRGLVIDSQDYGDRPLVLDPGDTILVPFRRPFAVKSPANEGRLWGELEFRVPGHDDLYSLRHHFMNVLLN